MTLQVTIMFGLSFMSVLACHFEVCYFYYDRLRGILIMFFSLKPFFNWNFGLLDFDFFVGLMLYHCLRHWPNFKTTLRQRFVFDGITTFSSMLICSI